MFLYYFIYISIFIGTIQNLLKFNKYRKYIFLFFCIIIGMFGGLRFQTGFDHEPYLEYYENLPYIDYSDGIPYLVGNMEIGYYFLNLILNFFYFHSQFILLIPSLFCIYCFYKLCTSIKSNYLLILMAYVSFNLVHNHFSLVRQSICVGLSYLAISLYLKNKKLFWIFFLFFISMLFHITTIFYLFIFLLSKLIQPREILVKSISIFLFIFSLFKIDLAFEFSKLLFNVDIFSIITSKYLDYGTIEYTQSLSYYLYILFNIFFIFFAYRFKQIQNISEKLQFLVIYASLIQVIFMTIFPSNYILFLHQLFLL